MHCSGSRDANERVELNAAEVHSTLLHQQAPAQFSLLRYTEKLITL